MKSRHDTQALIASYSAMGKKYLDRIDTAPSFDREKFCSMLPTGGRVLDVGCAGGRDTAAFVQHGFPTTAIDITPAFLRRAKKRVPRAQFFNMDVREMDFSNESFDGIWASAVLLHLKRKEIIPALKKFYTVLKTNGLVYVLLKYGKGEETQADVLSMGNKRTFTYFLKGEIEKMMRCAGFRLLSSRIVNDGVFRKDMKWISILVSKEK